MKSTLFWIKKVPSSEIYESDYKVNCWKFKQIDFKTDRIIEINPKTKEYRITNKKRVDLLPIHFFHPLTLCKKMVKVIKFSHKTISCLILCSNNKPANNSALALVLFWITNQRFFLILLLNFFRILCHFPAVPKINLTTLQFVSCTPFRV